MCIRDRLISGDNAVKKMVHLAGDFSPKEPSAYITFRSLLGTSIERNGLHRSDSIEAAQIEKKRFFS